MKEQAPGFQAPGNAMQSLERPDFESSAGGRARIPPAGRARFRPPGTVHRPVSQGCETAYAEDRRAGQVLIKATVGEGRRLKR